MYQHIDSLKEKTADLISKELYNSYKAEIREQYLRFEKLRNQIDGIFATEKTPAKIAEAIHDILEYSVYEEEGKDFELFAESFNTHLKEILDQVPEFIVMEQKPERFAKQPGDSFLIKIRKPFKNVAFGMSDSPRKIANVFRKSKKGKTYWKHEVPLKGLAEKHLRAEFVERITPLRSEYFAELTKAYTELLIDSVDQKIPLFDPKTLQKEFTKTRNHLKKDLLDKLDQTFSALSKEAELVGTLELKASNFSASEVSEAVEESNTKWRKEYKGWNNSLLLLHEEWRSDLELRKLTDQSKEALDTYQESQSKTFEQTISPDLNVILDFISESRELLDKTEDLSQSLKKTNYKAQKSLDESTIPALVEKLSSKNTINAVARLENTITQGLKSMSFDLRLCKTATQYQKPIPSSDITTIPLYELLEFEIAPALFRELDRIKGSFLSQLNKQITLSGDLDHMITFGLSTAIQQLEEHQNAESANRVSMETLQRAEDRVNEIKQALSNLFIDTQASLTNAVNKYNDELEALMVNENIREMRIRIAKAKTIQQTKAYRTELKSKAATYFDESKAYVTKRLKEANNFLSSFRQRFILTSKKDTASRAVSDFLASAEERIDALPVIYRNLYKTEPLTDLELFVGRKAELEQLSTAYTRWVEGKMGSVILYSEKWSGMTSFMNYVQNTSTFKHPITRFKCQTAVDNQTQFDEILKKIISSEEPTTYEEVQNKLLNGPKRIILLEDIQNLYLRKPGGFTVIKALLTLISNTAQHVFWMTTCTVYTFEFFKKTLHIHEIFSYPIGLKNPSEEDLNQIVQKRNRISGYKIYFEPEVSKLESKRFAKLSEEEQQEFLRRRFFKNLIDFSESNITMALMFWLLSTKSVDQDRIVINSFQKPDLSFLEILNLEKTQALHALILHDGLTVEQFSEVMRKKIQASYLLLSMMLEDGILVKKGNQYLVNTLVYRSVISLLKAKNLIH